MRGSALPDLLLRRNNNRYSTAGDSATQTVGMIASALGVSVPLIPSLGSSAHVVAVLLFLLAMLLLTYMLTGIK
jgi:VIT1/CCC1 family predicted Fe2+/Mn2+ transporter